MPRSAPSTRSRCRAAARLAPPVALMLALAVAAPPALAAWTPGGIPLCLAPGSQYASGAVSDGAGGAIVVYSDGQAFAQRVTAGGEIAAGWPANGRALCTAPGTRHTPLAVPDAAGGAFVVWVDSRNGPDDLFAQHVLGSGALDPAWDPAGVPVAVAPFNQYTHAVATDGAGGALVVWQDDRSGDLDIYAQRLNASGAPLWTVNGVKACGAAGIQFNPQVIGDGVGGAYLAWTDERSGIDRVYALRLDARGAVAPGWPTDGLPLTINFGGHRDPVLLADGVGGVFVAWSGSNNRVVWHTFIQRLDPSGVIAPGWPSTGVQLCNLLQSQQFPKIVSDLAGGAIVVWYDFRDIQNPVLNYDIYAQRVNAAGIPQWTTNGAAVCSAPSQQDPPVAVSDDQGGLIAAWTDHRGGDADIYAMRLMSNGQQAPGWIPDGSPLCAVAGDQINPLLVADGLSGAIAAWSDSRPAPRGQAPDIYAAKTIDDMAVPVLVSLVSADADPTRVRLAWRLPGAGMSARVERRAGSEGWTALGTAVSAGDGTLVFEDRSVSPGAAYDYRVAFLAGGVEVVAGEVRVEVPAGASFTLEGARPNPARDGLTVALSLPDGTPATLEVIDVTGRAIAGRVLDGLGAGRHLVRAAGSGELAPGLYFVRLTRADRVLVTRACVTR